MTVEKTDMINNIQQKARDAGKVLKPATWKEKGLRWSIGMATLILCIVMLTLSIYWSRSPSMFNVAENARQQIISEEGERAVPGSTTTAALITVATTMLDKPGGFLSNDVMPPSVMLDNMPNWEFGVLVQVRDLARALRNDMSRSQSQSLEDKDLRNAHKID